MTSDEMRQRIAGALFLAAFLAYGFGAGMVAGILEAANPAAMLAAKRLEFFMGAASMLLNSVIVVTIGWLLKPILALSSKTVSRVYLLTRVLEGAVLAAGVVAILFFMTAHDSLTPSAMMSARRANFFAYQLGMAILGFGSLFFCALLHRERLIPRFTALWGFCGYAIFFTGALLEFGGVGVGLLFSLPAGLFELFLGAWLIARGFNAGTHPTPLATQ